MSKKKVPTPKALVQITSMYFNQGRFCFYVLIEVVFKSGVTDTVAENICKGIGDLDISCLPETITAQTGRQYNFHFRSDQTSPQSKRDLLEIIATRLLANEVIESFNISM